ncbi:hypothetical protein [Streptomyces sp. NPDC058086]|uniref:hypothetical protein n=1 Tax=Streptomyces sp. NPDC058086 TaxID=3346334 RepID=UPI0036E48C3D
MAEKGGMPCCAPSCPTSSNALSTHHAHAPVLSVGHHSLSPDVGAVAAVVVEIALTALLGVTAVPVAIAAVALRSLATSANKR